MHRERTALAGRHAEPRAGTVGPTSSAGHLRDHGGIPKCNARGGLGQVRGRNRRKGNSMLIRTRSLIIIKKIKMFLDNLDILKLEKILSGKIQLIWLGQRNYGDFG